MGTGTPLPLDPHEMQNVRTEIRRVFTNLTDSFQVTSWPAERYNCVAWAADDPSNWWWPDPDGESFWPRGVERQDTVEAFIAAFRTIGYEPCESDDLETGCDKVAIYAIGNNAKHMARQLPSGAWTSKLGEWWDIGHHAIEEVEAPHYGIRVQILRRPSPQKISD
jgi:hypothetical protein